ncbi:MAG TPA: DUF1269 domain-containing protein [Baekduia sp.]|uniref:DUF1269 domain-containing protein n=1 Tax=Baekduia sp. TaxID=2600305 RepID=UPI002D78E8AC|nr:DUF1269 domain-containing protein [Baekduia sp.]HET6505354.1 DUF1269 domain-containing protein [Baekduia sp.]
MADHPMFLYLAAYETEADARADYDALRRLHADGVVGTYDAAIVTKDADGKVHVHKHEKPTQHGAWTGAGVGALLGILFPPSLIGSAVVGAAAGGLVGHLWRGLSRGDLKELGEALDAGEAGLVVIGRDELTEALDRALDHATKRVEKRLDADAEQFEKDLEQAQKG